MAMKPLIDEPISPELVLVDPELAQRVRAFAVAGPHLTVDLGLDRAPGATDTVAPAVEPTSDAQVVVEPLRAPGGTDTVAPAVEPTSDAQVVVEPLRAPGATDTVEWATGTPSAQVVVAPPVEPLRRRIPAVLRRTRLIEALALVSVVAFLGLALLPPRDAPHFVIPAEPGTASGTSSAIIAWSPRQGVDRYRVQLSYHGRVVYTATVRQASMPVPVWLRSGRYTWRVFAAESGRSTPTGPIENGLLTVVR